MTAQLFKRASLRRIVPVLTLMTASFLCRGQALLTPENTPFEKKWLKSGTYEMACYVIDGGNQVEISSFLYEVKLDKGALSIFTSMKLVGSDDLWIDTSVTDASFRPVYRSSFNRNRDLVLHYGKEISGYHYDKQSRKKTIVKDAVQTSFFDTYAYPYLLCTLPLNSGYNAGLSVYDYKPEHSSQIKKAVIEEVKTNRYISSLTGTHPVWQVSILEEANNDRYDYYIDKDTRRIWKVDIVSKGQHLLMIDKEIDYNPFKSTFDKAATMKLIKSGSAVISGQAFARDNENEGLLSNIAVVNINKKQYAKEGTTVVLIPYTDFFKEWIKLNESSRKKGRSVPLPKEAAECIKVAAVYDDKGSFEFVNLMPGEYLLYTEFGYVHTTRRTEVVGYTDTYVNGLFQGTTANTVSNSYAGNAGASIKKVVTVKQAGERVQVKLKKTL